MILLLHYKANDSASNLVLLQSFFGSLGKSFQTDLERGCVAVQNRLNGEPLEEYIQPVGGGYFFALPGVKDRSGYLGETLLKA